MNVDGSVDLVDSNRHPVPPAYMSWRLSGNGYLECRAAKGKVLAPKSTSGGGGFSSAKEAVGNMATGVHMVPLPQSDNPAMKWEMVDPIGERSANSGDESHETKKDEAVVSEEEEQDETEGGLRLVSTGKFLAAYLANEEEEHPPSSSWSSSSKKQTSGKSAPEAPPAGLQQLVLAEPGLAAASAPSADGGGSGGKAAKKRPKAGRCFA